jgi:hypothetical protein
MSVAGNRVPREETFPKFEPGRETAAVPMSGTLDKIYGSQIRVIFVGSLTNQLYTHQFKSPP